MLITRKKEYQYPVYFEHQYTNVDTSSGNKKLKLPPLEILKYIFEYDAVKGKLYRIFSLTEGILRRPRLLKLNPHSGNVSITDSTGIIKKYLINHICYYMHTGIEPLKMINHIDGDRTNIKFSNFKLADRQQVSRNQKLSSRNTSGINGISYDKDRNRWYCHYQDTDGKQIILRFKTKEEAIRARMEHERNIALKDPELAYSARHGIPDGTVGLVDVDCGASMDSGDDEMVDLCDGTRRTSCKDVRMLTALDSAYTTDSLETAVETNAEGFETNSDRTFAPIILDENRMLWKSFIKIKDTIILLGEFPTFDEAVEARREILVM